MSKQSKLGDIVFSSKEMKDALHANADGAMANYVGINDDMVNFGEAESFVDESEGSKEFSLRITNGSQATQKLQFNEIIENVAGHALLKEGQIAEGLTAEGDPRSIDALIAYILANPTRVRSVKLNVSEEGQLDEPLKFIRETPFMTSVTKQTVPSTYQTQNTTNTKTVEVDLKDWILGNSSTILYSVRAGVSVNMTFCFGASLDTAEALRKKHARATKTAASFFARQNA